MSTKDKPALFDLGLWNLYFSTKLVMSLKGALSFSPLYNFTLFAFLLIPTPDKKRTIIKNSIGVILAIALWYSDSFLPPFNRLLEQLPNLKQFDTIYLIELLSRFISIESIITLLFMITVYLLANLFLKVTTFVLIAMIYMTYSQTSFFIDIQPTPIKTANNHMQAVPTRSQDKEVFNLNQLKTDFFINEESKASNIHQATPVRSHFDILLLNICSIAWDDLRLTGQINHPLFSLFDISFSNFNSATSYSGPAVIRLLRASCGQQEHSSLFSSPENNECLLFNNLEQLGFRSQLILNHDGNFANFMTHIKNNIGDIKPAVALEPLPIYQKSFDGSAIYRDFTILSQWLSQQASQSSSTVALYNSISAHDGNRLVRSESRNSLMSYKKQQKNILDDIYNFMTQLKNSKRNYVVVFVPEHGAALRGDKMQIQGMREIPTKIITHVPVGVKLIGPTLNLTGESITISESSSYLAISDLIGNIITNDVFSGNQISLSLLTQGLDQTEFVSQNEGTTMMGANSASYLTLDDKNWILYEE